MDSCPVVDRGVGRQSSQNPNRIKAYICIKKIIISYTHLREWIYLINLGKQLGKTFFKNWVWPLFSGPKIQVELLAPGRKRKRPIEKTSIGKVLFLRHAARLREGMS